MSFVNLGFEDEDATAIGFPDVWTIAQIALAEEAAGFDDGQTTPPDSPNPFESFGGGWSANQSYTFAYDEPPDLLEIFPAFFDNALPDPEGFEDFEEGWSTNQNYLFAMGSIVAAIFDGESVEDFEEGWDNVLGVGYFFTWAEVESGPGTDAADFDTFPTIPLENFERQWRSNESFDFTLGFTTGAIFDTGTGGGSEPVEDFEEVNAIGVVVVNVGTDTFTKTAHGMSVNQIVTFENEGGALPGGLNSGTNYFLISVVANTFQVSATLGGAAVDILDAGTGTQRVRPDVATFWTSIMATL